MEYCELFYPAHFAVGEGSLAALAAFGEKNDLHRAFIVTDAFLGSSEVMAAVRKVLAAANIGDILFDGVRPNPGAETVDQAVLSFQAAECDFILAVGGGSAIDTAKGVALTAANGGSVRNYIGVNRSLHRGVPLVAVATTAGTGSEVTKAFVLTDHENHTKAVSLDDHCLVDLAISDPVLMRNLPWEITAATGLDALTHAIEAYCAVNHNPFSDGLALEAIRLIDGALLKLRFAPDNMALRTDLCWAASLAGYAFSNSGLGLIHSIGFSIENFCDIPHGAAVGLVMPYVLDFNRRQIADRVIALGAACGIDDTMTVGTRTVRHFYDLQRDAGMMTLAETDLAVADIPALAAMAMADPTLSTNAIQPTLEEMTGIIESIYCEDMKR